MSDDLLDEATRLANTAPPGSAAEHILKTPRVLRALVERVQQAEADVRWMTDAFTAANESCQAESRAKWEALAERDAAQDAAEELRWRLADAERLLAIAESKAVW